MKKTLVLDSVIVSVTEFKNGKTSILICPRENAKMTKGKDPEFMTIPGKAFYALHNWSYDSEEVKDYDFKKCTCEDPQSLGV